MKKNETGYLAGKEIKVGQWLYFAKKGKKGTMIGKVLGRGYFLGEKNGHYVFSEGDYWRTFTPKTDEVVVYTLGSDQHIQKVEATQRLSKISVG